MTNVIRAFERPVADLFCDKFLFSIPPFQRPYGWTREQAGELLDDLHHAMLSGGDAGAPYFLGTIVVIKMPDQPPADVVDGQQRLATLAILLAVLRDLASAEDASQIDQYIRQKGRKFEGIEDNFRLNLRDQDQSVFQKYIQESGRTRDLPDPESFESDSQQRIIDNAAFFRAILSNWSGETRLELMSYIVQHCFLVVVQATDREAAYRVFAVMNDRGLDLSPTDVLKAEIIGGIPLDEREAYNSVWELYEEALGRDNFRDLFSHIDLIFHRQKRRTSLEQSFREHVLRFVAPRDFIAKYLEPLGECYLNLVKCDYRAKHHAEDINAYLRQLWRLDFSDWQPAALAAMTTFSRRPGALCEALRRLERLSYGFFMMRTHVNNRVSRYCAVIDELMSHQSLSNDRSSIDLTDDEIDEILGVLDGPIYTVTRVRKLLLLRLDEALSDGTARYAYRTVSVEHVLPQRPAEGSDWFDAFPEAADRRYWTHRLANLVLLSRKKNSAASNWDFERKKLTYFSTEDGSSAFVVTSQVISQKSWDVATLEARQKMLIDKLAALWSLHHAATPGFDLAVAHPDPDAAGARLN